MSASPILLVRVELEELPISIVLAGSYEDEQRLRGWLASPAARRRVIEAVQDALDGLAGKRAA